MDTDLTAKNMTELLHDGPKTKSWDADIYVQRAAEIFGVAPWRVTPELRAEAKARTWVLNYMDSKSFEAQVLGKPMTAAEAADYLEEFKRKWRIHPRIVGATNYLVQVDMGELEVRILGHLAARHAKESLEEI